jgi:hypothetical protein
MKTVLFRSFGLYLLSTSLNLTAQSPPSVVTDETDKGEDFTVYSQVASATDATGHISYTTNRFTLLENALNYFEDGQWKLSEDIIESFPDGAVARRGPNKAIFSHDLNTDVVFDISAPGGTRLRGGVRAIQLTDLASGKSVVLATVKDKAPGELLPPNQIVFRDAFQGAVHADVVIAWKHNLFVQDIVLRSRPQIPDGVSTDSTVLEIVTEFIEPPRPEIRQQVIIEKDQPEFVNDTIIHFGRLVMIGGNAFAAEGGRAYTVGWNPVTDGTPIRKQWHTLPDSGRTFLLESVRWKDLQPNLEKLEARRDNPVDQSQIRNDRLWPKRLLAFKKRKPLQIASTDYRLGGYMLDLVIIPDQGTPTTFLGTETYYIKTYYGTSLHATFQPGSTIKYKNNAYMYFYDSPIFPTSGANVVFTSRDDDSFGFRIQGVSGEGDSDSDPTDHMANPAIWLHYPPSSWTLSKAQVRWATLGVRYDGTFTASQYIQNSLFQECTTGVSTPSGTFVQLTGVQQCDVITATVGYVAGGMALSPVCDTLVNSAANDLNNFYNGQVAPQQNTQNETAVTVANSKIIAAWMDTNHGHEA